MSVLLFIFTQEIAPKIEYLLGHILESPISNLMFVLVSIKLSTSVTVLEDQPSYVASSTLSLRALSALRCGFVELDPHSVAG